MFLHHVIIKFGSECNLGLVLKNSEFPQILLCFTHFLMGCALWKCKIMPKPKTNIVPNVISRILSRLQGISKFKPVIQPPSIL